MVSQRQKADKQSAKLKFSEKEVAYNYRYSEIFDTAVEIGDLKGQELQPDPSVQCATLEFTSEADVVLSLQTRKKQEFQDRWFKILPNLETLNLINMSTERLQAMESEIIDELDRLRKVNPETGDLEETEEYNDLEEMLRLLHEACRCISQTTDLENHSEISNPSGQAPIHELPSKLEENVQTSISGNVIPNENTKTTENNDKMDILPHRKKGFGLKFLFSCFAPRNEVG